MTEKIRKETLQAFIFDLDGTLLDTLGDLAASVNYALQTCGMPCISVLWGFRDREFLLAHGATQFISHPSELLTLFE